MDIPNTNQIPQLLAYERATLSENMHIYNLRQKHFGWNGSISQLRQKEYLYQSAQNNTVRICLNIHKKYYQNTSKHTPCKHANY